MSVRLRRRYASEEVAERLLRALEADQAGYVHAERDGSELRFAVRSEEPRQARATLEDLLACLSAAERTLGITPVPVPEEE
ncbi:MAG: hypothetical protein L3K19_00520 [Thermoplasmata archaeon]|nr:hypothetical protein [Thermoplasmata archaeon]